MSWEATAPFVNDLLRFALVAAAVVVGTLLVVAQRRIGLKDAETRATEARAKETLAKAELQKQENAASKDPNAPQPSPQPESGGGVGDVTGVGTELVKGLSASAPMLAGGIFLYILAAVVLGALTFSVGASAGGAVETGTGTSQCAPPEDCPTEE